MGLTRWRNLRVIATGKRGKNSKEGWREESLGGEFLISPRLFPHLSSPLVLRNKQIVSCG